MSHEALIVKSPLILERYNFGRRIFIPQVNHQFIDSDFKLVLRHQITIIISGFIERATT
jgi:hypothetical protein